MSMERMTDRITLRFASTRLKYARAQMPRSQNRESNPARVKLHIIDILVVDLLVVEHFMALVYLRMSVQRA